MAKKIKKCKQRKPLFYRFLKSVVKIFYRKREFIGLENIPKEGSVLVANHCQIHSPATFELYFPLKKRIWCESEMFYTTEVPDYAIDAFWSDKPKKSRWFYRILSYLIALPAGYVFVRADTLPVYRDNRILATFRQSAEYLNEGYHNVIFADSLEKNNEIINHFNQGFVDVARLYYKKYGKELDFVPVYSAPTIKKVVIGKPVKFDHTKPFEEERKRIVEYIENEIYKMAKSLPPHIVIPFENTDKKLRQKSK